MSNFVLVILQCVLWECLYQVCNLVILTTIEHVNMPLVITNVSQDLSGNEVVVSLIHQLTNVSFRPLVGQRDLDCHVLVRRVVDKAKYEERGGNGKGGISWDWFLPPSLHTHYKHLLFQSFTLSRSYQPQ